MGNLIESDNSLFKASLVEISILAAKAGISSIPIAAFAVDLVSSVFKLSNEEDVRNYILTLHNKIEDLEIQIDDLAKNKAYQQFNQKRLVDIKAYYTDLDHEIEAQLALGLAQLNLNLPLNQMVYDAALSTDPLMIKVFWVTKIIQDLKESELAWDKEKQVGEDHRCDWHERLSALYGNYLKLLFPDNIGTNVPSKLEALGLIEPISLLSSGVNPYMFPFSELSPIGKKLAEVISPIDENMKNFFKNTVGFAIEDLRRKMVVDLNQSIITFTGV
jgi:hypothetical protein